MHSLLFPVKRKIDIAKHYSPNMEFGRRVRQLRKELGLTQVQLAKAVGVDQSSISEIERGNVAWPSAKLTLSLAKALGVPTDYLVTGEEGLREKMLRPDILELAYKLQQLPRDKVQLIASTVAAFGPAVPDERVAQFIQPAPTKKPN